MQDNKSFLKGLAVGLALAVVFTAGRVTAQVDPSLGVYNSELRQMLSEFKAFRQDFNSLRSEGMPIKARFGDEITVKVKPDTFATIPVEIKGEVNVKNR